MKDRIPVQAAITTTDNIFDPFTEFDQWNNFDISKGYNSIARVDRYDISADDWPDVDKALAYEDAVDKVVALNITGNYKKVTRPY